MKTQNSGDGRKHFARTQRGQAKEIEEVCGCELAER